MLNLDTLSFIIPHLNSRQDVSSFMRTSKAFYGVSIPHLLHGGVSIRKARQADAFCTFMLAKSFSSVRFESLTQLDVDFRFSSKTLIQVMQRAITLRDLSLSELEPVLGTGDIGAAVYGMLKDTSSYPKLEKFTVANIGEKTQGLLGIMKSTSIKELSLSYDTDPELDTLELSPSLRAFRSTITCLTLRDAELRSVDIQCPHVQTLTTDAYGFAVMRSMVYTFPNLKDLFFYNDAAGDSDDDELKHSRQVNLLTPAWSRLRHVRMDANDVYAMGLSCPVHDLSMMTVVKRNVAKTLHAIEGFRCALT